MTKQLVMALSLCAVLVGGVWTARSYIDDAVDAHASTPAHADSRERLARIETTLEHIQMQLDTIFEFMREAHKEKR